MQTTAACPELARYRKLASGQLSSPEKEAVLEHLEKCQVCARRVEALSEKDTLVDLILQARTLGDGPPGESVARLVERLRKLRPSAGAAPEASAQVRLACSGCGKALKVKGSLAGKKVHCPNCRAVVRVPNALEPQGEDSPRSSAPEGDEAMTLAPAGPVGGRSSAENPSGPGAGRPRPAGKELYDFLAPAPSPDELGRLGPYRILRVLGAGGMGVVFQAEDPNLQRLVALKAMLPGLAASESAKQRFLREARAAAALKHDHVVTIHQVGEDRGVPFLAMEFLDGEPLDDCLKRAGRLPLAAVLRIGREMAEGLAAAHECGLIHRDIKPANVWLAGKKGRVKILDFGLARAATDEAHLTQSGAIVGTPAYMAPEQAQGLSVDPRCDLFSLGCVLYRLSTGAAPFRGTDMISTLMAVATEDPTPPVSLNPELPAELSDFIMRLLAKEPADRPESAQAVSDALQRMERDHQSPATAKAGARQGKGKSGRLAAVTAACAAVALVAAGVVLYWPTSNGIVRIEIDDPKIEVVFDRDGPTFKGAGTQEIKLTSGKHGLHVKRGDLEFHTDKLVLKMGETTTLKVEWLEGKLLALQDGERIGEKIQAVEGGKGGGKIIPEEANPAKFTNGLGMEFVVVPPGKSWLGGGNGKLGSKEVEIAHAFYLGVYLVTQEEWEKVASSNPSQFRAVRGVAKEDQKRFPVDSVSWEEAQAFTERLNKQLQETGWVYRLPREAEWEYACRGGPGDKLESGFDFYLEKPAYQLLPGQANFEHGQGLRQTCKVGSYKPNRLGLYDMHGNVWEWCDDILDTTDAKLASLRVLRGGSWDSHVHNCSAWARRGDPTSHRNGNVGLRLARVPVGKEIIRQVTPGAKRPSGS